MASPPPKVDRQTTTPFLLKLFYRNSTYHHLSEFSPHSTSPAPPHLQIYTWPSCTLRELTHLLVSALPSLLPQPAIGTRLIFRLIFPDTRGAATGREGMAGRYISKDLGSVVIGGGGPGIDVEDADGDMELEDGAAKPQNGGRTDLENLEGDADKTLAEARFVIGDYVACAIFPPLPDGSVAPAPPPSTGRFGAGRGGPPPMRENGYGGGGYGGPGNYGPRRGGGRLGFEDRGRLGGGGVPSGEWRRGEVPEGPPGGYARGRGRSRGW